MGALHAFLRGLRPTLHVAHRGGAALAPENTMAAFRSAVDRWRTDMIELDVRATRDGEVVVIHDATLDRTTDGEGPVAERSWADLARLDAGFRFTADGGRTHPFRGTGVGIPRLSEVLRDLQGPRVNVEIKTGAEGIEPRVADVVRRAGAVDRVCVGSEDDAIARCLLEALPEACHFYPRQALTDVVFALREGASVPDAPWIVLDMPLWFLGTRLVDPVFLERAREAGKWVNVWVVDDPEEMRRCVAEGVGGVMTDRPDLLREAIEGAR